MYESEHTVLSATPQTRESLRAAMRKQLEEDYREPAPEEVEEMAAFARLIGLRSCVLRQMCSMRRAFPPKRLSAS